MLTSTVIMIPDKSFVFAKSKKSDNLMKFPAFLYLGFLDRLNELHGFDIVAVNMEMSVKQHVIDQWKELNRWTMNCSPDD
jgi:hypothetical protein